VLKNTNNFVLKNYSVKKVLKNRVKNIRYLLVKFWLFLSLGMYKWPFILQNF